MKKLATIILLLIIPYRIMAQTSIIAHRGFWDTDGSAQNSIAALAKADSIGCYGSEFDVRLSADNELIVNHDPFYKCKLISKTSSAALNRLKLKNGERLPLLSEYLKKGKELCTRLVLELKPLKNQNKETEAVTKIISLVSSMSLEGRMVYISFSLHAVKEFIRLAPKGTPVYYLNGDLPPKELKQLGCAPNYNLKTYRKHPEWIREAHNEGLKAGAWTIDKEQEMRWLIERGIDYITTNNPVLLQEILGSTEKQ